MTKDIFKKLIGLTFIISFTAILNANAGIKSFVKSDNKVTFTLDKGYLVIRFCRNNVAEIIYTTLSDLPAHESLIIKSGMKPTGNFTISEKNGKFEIITPDLRIIVDKMSNAITFTDPGGRVILAEDGIAGKSMTPASVAGLSVYTCQTQFLSPADEALYGLGCHPEDTLSVNYKGRNQELVIKYMAGAIPVLLSNKGYGLMWDNYSPSYFYGAEEQNTKFKYVSESGELVDYYFFYGPSFDRIIASYREITGEAPMFPKWSFGLFQSQDRYKSQEEVLSVKDKYRNNKIPLDCIVQDWFYWEPDVIGSHIFWPARYPDPKLMVDELHKANIHAMISIWPVMAKGTANYSAMEKAGNLTSITWDNVMTHTFDNYYDAHSQKARLMYWEQARDSLIAKHGWDAWWVDQCEPDNGALLDERRKCNFATGRGIDYFNTYSLMHTKGLYENWRKDIKDKRAFFLVRQSFAGQQRNAATLWSSDITCTWRAFKSQVPQGINACASGIPYWTSDIGGYHFHWAPPDWSTPDNRELFIRWFQFGTFCPIFRIHGKGERALFSDNWDAKTKTILLDFDNLRYRLLPYIYSLSWKVTNEGYTIMRSLAFDFKDDAGINSIPDQYMFGPAFLVNPVTEPMYGTDNAPVVRTRPVYLPGKSKWYNFWTGELSEGGRSVNAAAPLSLLPLYVRAGSIIPMGPRLQYATEKAEDPLELRIYIGANAEFVLYEDENDGYNYEKGLYSTISLKWDDTTRKLIIGKRNGSFPGMMGKRTFNIVLVSKGKGTGTEVTGEPDKSIIYTGVKKVVQL